MEASGQVRLFKRKWFEIKSEIQFLSLGHFAGAQEPRLADGCSTIRHKDRKFSITTEGSVGQSWWSSSYGFMFSKEELTSVQYNLFLCWDSVLFSLNLKMLIGTPQPLCPSFRASPAPSWSGVLIYPPALSLNILFTLSSPMALSVQQGPWPCVKAGTGVLKCSDSSPYSLHHQENQL